MTFDLEGLRIEFENYEYGVKHIIPSSLAEEVDGAFTDELMNILHARSYLERELFLQPESQELAEYRKKLEQLDSLLYAKRGVLLKIVPNFAQGRKSLRRMPPRSHWWWYLDGLEEYEGELEVIPLSSGLLGVAFSEEVATKIGLQPGQSLKVHIPDDKHIVISLT